MFIIWGTRPLTKNFGTTSQALTCRHCNNTSYFNIVSHKIWFTLYLIPIFPIEIERKIECPICEYGYTVKKDQFKEILKEEGIGV